MKIILSDRVQRINEAAMATMGKLSRELKTQGKDVVTLSLGEPDFNTPTFIKDAAKKAIDQDFSHYSPIPGFMELRQQVCYKLQRDNNLSYNPEQIVISTGAKNSIMNAIFALINPGDEVILPAPFWASYYDMILLAGGIPKIISTSINSGFKISALQLESAVSDKTKMLIFNSPNNPGGFFYNENEIDTLAEVLKRFPQLFVISDEIYEFFIYSGEKQKSFASFPDLYERIILVNGVSKSFAMTGWRIGYMAAHKDIARACDKIQGQITSGPNSIAQQAAIVALQKSPDRILEIENMRAEFKKRRDFVFAQLSEIKQFKTLLPEGAFYIFPDVSACFGTRIHGTKINNCNELAMLILNEALVSTTSGEAFGMPECLRISYANSTAELQKAMERIRKLML
ncbi:MAG: aspartate aminotransferase [Bacteroidetes bacterium CG2_30_33_31]|nr:MAG: aspartate aminotransferase [Bacteroidetes bacterium CG2_30_33_31]